MERRIFAGQCCDQGCTSQRNRCCALTMPITTFERIIDPEPILRKDPPLRPIRTMVDKVLKVLKEISPEFDKMYSKVGRPSIPPEQLLRALLLQMLYSVRSERLLMEEVDYNILFRWFVGLNSDDAVWDAGAGNAAGTSGKRARDGGRRQGLRHGGFRARVQEYLGDAARGAKYRTKRRQRYR
jgi:Transposase domain (DUF772)